MKVHVVSLHFQPVECSLILEVSKSKPVLQVYGGLFERLNFSGLKILMNKKSLLKNLPGLGKRTENVTIPLV